MAPSRHDWKIVDWDVKPQHNQPTFPIWCLGQDVEFDFIIYLRKIPLSTTNFPTQKYKILHHASRVFQFGITILAYVGIPAFAVPLSNII